MKISKKILGAIVVGIAAQAVLTSSCTKKDKETIKPQTESSSNSNPENQQPNSCPACGMG